MAPKDRYLTKEDEFPEHLRIAKSDLHVGRLIGRGSSSEVYRAYWLGCEVAVKQLHMLQDFQFRTFKSHALELEILMRLSHPHVVQLLGYHVDPRVVSIVMEYMEISLAEVIAHRMRISSRPFAPCEALDIITKIALGMKFLHSRGIIHGCLSTGIVLMNVHPQSRFDVKIGGFTFSHYMDSFRIPFKDRLKFNPSPEIQVGELKTDLQVQRLRIAADVYHFARICHEILTGRQALIKPGLPPTDIDYGLEQLICKCWDRKPENRPDFVEICNILVEIQAVRNSTLKQRTVTEDYALQWTTHKEDEDNTCVEIANIFETFPDHLSVDPADVQWRRFIGQGGYNKVYEVNWLGCTFAVKRFKSLSVSLKEELDFLIKLQHPHIARLIGLSLDDNGGWIMMERMDMDLRKLIDARMHQKKSRYSWTSSAPFRDNEVWELCHKIALGMTFLHSKQIVHRDIKAANVLVHDCYGRFDVKIADFGVSHRIGNPNVAERAGTGLWRAPEVLKGEKLTEEKLKKTDVYSYAMTCYEIITGNFPFEGEVVDALSRPLHSHVHREDVILGCRPKLPADLDPDFVKLISDCWQDDPAERPDFTTICNVFASNSLRNVILPHPRAVTLFELLWRTLLFFIRWLGIPTVRRGEKKE